MAPVPFPFNVLGDYNGADPPRCPGHQQAPTKHAHRNHRGPGIANLGRETRHSAPTMKSAAGRAKASERAPERASYPLHQQGERRRLSISQRKPARVGKAPSAPTMESAAGRGRRAASTGCAVRRTAQHKSAPSRARNGRGLKVGVYRWVDPTGQTMTR